MRFDQYMAHCLYDPERGFYASGRGRAGRRRGDFVTSPEVGPLFGAVLAGRLDHWWVQAGRPDPFVVVDVGSGPGTLLRTIAAAEPRCASVLQLIEVDPASGPTSLDDIDHDLEGAVILANELLDNLPVRVVERREEGWFELHETDGEAGFQPLEGDSPPFELAVGERAPWLQQAARWVTDALARRPGHLVLFDYGVATTRELVERGGWLRTYREHQRGDDPFREPGLWDITVDVAFDQLPAPHRLVTQAELLTEWGIDSLVEEGRRYWHSHAAHPDLAALRMRSRVSEAAALLDPDGLGAFLVALWEAPTRVTSR